MVRNEINNLYFYCRILQDYLGLHRYQDNLKLVLIIESTFFQIKMSTLPQSGSKKLFYFY